MLALLIQTGSDHDRSRVPVATWSLIAANTLIYVVTVVCGAEQVARRFGFVAADPRPDQFVTHMFLHGSLLHLGGNMAYLWFAGSDLEDVLGTWKYLAVYLVGGLASALLFWFTAVAGHFPNLDEPAVGASGAISALLGLYLVRFPRFKIRLWFGAIIPFPFILRQGITRISSLLFIGFWIGMQLFYGIQALHAGGAEVAYWGHIGGFSLGLAVGLLTRQWRHGSQEYLFKEAEYLFYKQKWYPAMDRYQQLAKRFPRCVEAYLKWALCWECTGALKRAEKVLLDALAFCQQQGWSTEAAAIQEELTTVLGNAEADAIARAREKRARELAGAAGAAPNLMFRREFKWKGKKP